MSQSTHSEKPQKQNHHSQSFPVAACRTFSLPAAFVGTLLCAYVQYSYLNSTVKDNQMIDSMFPNVYICMQNYFFKLISPNVCVFIASMLRF